MISRHKHASTPHTIDTFELMSWLADEERAWVLFASSSREAKALEVAAGRSTFRVTRGGGVVYLGTQPGEAVEAYNAITSKL